jgi:MFS family permease
VTARIDVETHLGPGSPDVGRAVAVLALCALPGFIAGAVVDEIRADLAFSDGALGIAFASFWGSAAIAAAPAGRLVRRIGATASVRLAGLVAAGTSAAVGAFVHSAPALILLMLVGGTSIALATPAVNVILIGALRPGRRALAFGIAQSSPALAILLAGLAVPGLAQPLGWRPVYLVAAALALAATLLIRGVPGSVAERSPSARPNVRPLALMMAGMTAASAAIGALNAFLVASAPSAGVSYEAAGLILAVGAAISIAFRIALGVRADRHGKDPLPLVAGLLAGGALGYVMLTAQVPALFVTGALFALVFGWAWISLFGYAVVSRYVDSVESATGVMQTGFFAGGVLGPLAFGMIVEFGTFALAWTALAVAMLVGAATIAGGRRALPVHPSGSAHERAPRPAA